MQNMYYDVETDSTVDNVIEPSDHAGARAPDNVEEPIFAGSLNVLTSGLQTDTDARQAAAPDAGQRTEGFELLDYPAARQPSAASEAVASQTAEGAHFCHISGSRPRSDRGFLGWVTLDATTTNDMTKERNLPLKETTL